eukprot:COSAG04_NODE_7520_length_1115_cov_1.022638_1_plen_341_part_10
MAITEPGKVSRQRNPSYDTTLDIEQAPAAVPHAELHDIELAEPLGAEPWWKPTRRSAGLAFLTLLGLILVVLVAGNFSSLQDENTALRADIAELRSEHEAVHEAVHASLSTNGERIDDHAGVALTHMERMLANSAAVGDLSFPHHHDSYTLSGGLRTGLHGRYERMHASITCNGKPIYAQAGSDDRCASEGWLFSSGECADDPAASGCTGRWNALTGIETGYSECSASSWCPEAGLTVVGNEADTSSEPLLPAVESGATDEFAARVSCPSGSFLQPNDGCVECEAGQHNPDEGATDPSACVDCATGQYQPRPGASSCEDCAAGRYQATSGQSSCISCAAGW